MRARLSHIEIYVKSLERIKDFWDWFFEHIGWQRYQQWAQGCSWIDGGVYIVFVEVTTASPVPFNRRNPGLNHLAFRVATPQEIDDLTNLLRIKGIRILYEDRHPHAGGPSYYGVFFADPDGLKVEVFADSWRNDPP
ncbi:VOC family protein [Sulfobacillus thermosulfidooxidans]|uniref:VOC family protein n=1 Tax=Sulfobacillus thermosulfidooxidans TaxID=28034 RepID=UPI0006B57F93|nr:VOC family protein [Sulfobacillus thermosulfidooxidans]